MIAPLGTARPPLGTAAPAPGAPTPPKTGDPGVAKETVSLSTGQSSAAKSPTSAASAAPKKRGWKSIALAIGLTLSGVGVVASLIPPPHVSVPREMTTLQKHISYFDRNHDGQVTMGETYHGLRDMHLGVGKSMFSAFAINAALGPKTSTTWWQPTTINLNNIHLAKHGSDTGIIDSQGRFVQGKYDEMWQKWDPKGQGFITESNIIAMRAANKTDAPGGLGSKAEFDLLMDLAGQKKTVDGAEVRVLTRDTLASLYKGGLFYQLAGRGAEAPQ